MSKEHPNDLDVRQKLLIASWMSLWPMKVEKYRYGLSTYSIHKNDGFRTVPLVFLMHWDIDLVRHMASLTASPP